MLNEDFTLRSKMNEQKDKPKPNKFALGENGSRFLNRHTVAKF